MADLTDHGPEPYAVDIEKATLENENFRATLWTGKFLQMTVMTIPPGGEVGLEKHDDHDQFIRVEQGKARAQMGDTKNDLSYDKTVSDDWVVMVPAGKWHNFTNTGDEPLKLYSLYGPPDHMKGTVHATKEEADSDPNEQE